MEKRGKYLARELSLEHLHHDAVAARRPVEILQRAHTGDARGMHGRYTGDIWEIRQLHEYYVASTRTLCELGFVTCTKAATALPPLPAALPAACHVATREMHGRYVTYKPKLCLLPASGDAQVQRRQTAGDR